MRAPPFMEVFPDHATAHGERAVSGQCDPPRRHHDPIANVHLGTPRALPFSVNGSVVGVAASRH